MSRIDLISKIHPELTTSRLKNAPKLICGCYLIYASLWILLSDIVLVISNQLKMQSFLFGAFKGIAFVTLTGFLLFKHLKIYVDIIINSNKESELKGIDPKTVNLLFNKDGKNLSQEKILEKEFFGIIADFLLAVNRSKCDSYSVINRLEREPDGTKYIIRFIKNSLTVFVDVQKIYSDRFLIKAIDLHNVGLKFEENLFFHEFHNFLAAIGLPSAVINLVDDKIVSKNDQFEKFFFSTENFEKLITLLKYRNKNQGVSGSFPVSFINTDGVREFYQVINIAPAINRNVVGVALVKNGNIAVIDYAKKNLDETLLEIIDHSNIAVLAFDDTGRIFYCSRKWIEILGNAFNVGANIHAYDLYENKEKISDFIKSAISQIKEMRKIEIEINDMVYELSCSEVLTMNGYVLNLQDITAKSFERKSLLEKAQNLQNVNDRMIDIQERERYRISKDLHDDLGHDLLLVKLMTEANVPYKEILQSIVSAIKKLKQVCVEVHPGGDLEINLISAIENQVHRINTTSDCLVNIDIQGNEPKMKSSKKLAIYRIFQEALTNAIRHGDKSHIRLNVTIVDFVFRLEISNKFIGKPEEWRQGLGLTSMKNRALSIGGEIDFSSFNSLYRVVLQVKI